MTQGARSLIADLIDLQAVGMEVTELGDAGPPPPSPGGVVRVGIDRAGARPARGLEAFDILLSADPRAPRPWVGLAPEALDAALAELKAAAAAQPAAASVAAQVLRTSLKVSFEEALAAESIAYSMLLASADFKSWREARPRRDRGDGAAPRVATTREDGRLVIQLTRPAARNAVDARMRDALVEVLETALLDPDEAPVVLSGEGPDFSAGGDLDEFGSLPDPALAHLIRSLRSAALFAHRLGPRLTARLHGAGMGAGIEIPAAASRVIATPDARFRLPEVSMGLIPGAGGTATLPRRIGRRRTCFLAISGRTIDAETALAWGLVDQIEAAR